MSLESLAALMGLAGWALATWGLMELVGEPWVWKLSVGVLLLGLFGYGTLWHLFRAGLLGLNVDQDQGAVTDGTSTEGSP